MKHILVTTDLSEAAEVAYPEARLIAQQMGQANCQITLLYISEDILSATFEYSLGVEPELIHLDLERQAREKLQQIEATFFDGILLSTAVIRAIKPVANEICGFARSHQIGLIVTATHGRSGLEHMLQGSVVEKILRLAPCPVLVVPSRKRIDKQE